MVYPLVTAGMQKPWSSLVPPPCACAVAHARGVAVAGHPMCQVNLPDGTRDASSGAGVSTTCSAPGRHSAIGHNRRALWPTTGATLRGAEFVGSLPRAVWLLAAPSAADASSVAPGPALHCIVTSSASPRRSDPMHVPPPTL